MSCLAWKTWSCTWPSNTYNNSSWYNRPLQKSNLSKLLGEFFRWFIIVITKESLTKSSWMRRKKVLSSRITNNAWSQRFLGLKMVPHYWL
jgi:hypothetical protein